MWSAAPSCIQCLGGKTVAKNSFSRLTQAECNNSPCSIARYASHAEMEKKEHVRCARKGKRIKTTCLIDTLVCGSGAIPRGLLLCRFRRVVVWQRDLWHSSTTCSYLLLSQYYAMCWNEWKKASQIVQFTSETSTYQYSISLTKEAFLLFAFPRFRVCIVVRISSIISRIPGRSWSSRHDKCVLQCCDTVTCFSVIVPKRTVKVKVTICKY